MALPVGPTILKLENYSKDAICGAEHDELANSVVVAQTPEQCNNQAFLMQEYCQAVNSDYSVQILWDSGKCNGAIFEKPTVSPPCCLQEGTDPYNPNLCSEYRSDGPTQPMPCCPGFESKQIQGKYVCSASD
jgi:hypothetical protein